MVVEIGTGTVLLAVTASAAAGHHEDVASAATAEAGHLCTGVTAAAAAGARLLHLGRHQLHR